MSVVNADAKPHSAWVESPCQAIPAAAVLTADQGRELARLQVLEMIRKIQHRARLQRMNRGLTVSLPYFEDASQELHWREIVVIPRGRIPFVPAFVVLAARREISCVCSESHLSETTRTHLVAQLETLAEAFEARASSGCAS